MTEVVRPCGDARVSVEERPEVVAWAGELRALFDTVGVSINRFSTLHPIDKGTVSRYLAGKRVPGSRWFLDQLLAMRLAAGQPVTDQVREHLIDLQLQALQVAHPHDYRVRMVKDELEIAVTGLREAERHVRELEEQLTERNRMVKDLTAATEELRTAWDATHAETARLQQEIADVTLQLHHAQQRRDRAERRCQELEDLAGQLGPYQEPAPTTDIDLSARRLSSAIQLIETATPQHRLDGVAALQQLAVESPAHRNAVKVLIFDFVRQYEQPAGRSALPVPLGSREPLQAALTALHNHPGELGGLVNADLSRLDLHGIILKDTDLTGADLTGADLTGADLTGADLTGADLTAVNLTGADLTGIYLTGANLTGTNLTAVNLTGAKLTGAKLTDAKLTRANLIDADLIDVNLTRTDLIDADLAGAKLTGADLTGAKLTGAKLTGADLTDAFLTRANLIDADLAGALLAGAKSTGADLAGTDLAGTDLAGTDLTGAMLTGAKLTGADLTHANLADADLAGANLADADLTGANLCGANLRTMRGLSAEQVRNVARTDGTTKFDRGGQGRHRSGSLTSKLIDVIRGRIVLAGRARDRKPDASGPDDPLR